MAELNCQSYSCRGAREGLQACAPDIPGKQRAGRSSRWGNRMDSFQLPCKSQETVLQLESAYRFHSSTHRHLPRKRPRGPLNLDHATPLLGSPVSLWVPTLHPREVPRSPRHAPESPCSAPPRRLGYRRADTAPSASSRSQLLRVHKVPAAVLAPVPSRWPRTLLL